MFVYVYVRIINYGNVYNMYRLFEI